MTARWTTWAAFAGVFLWFGLFAFIGLDIHHDGIMLKTAADIADGRVLFRETYCHYGILTPFLQGLAVRIFGAEVLVIRLGTVLFYAFSFLWLARIGKLLLAERFRWIPLVLFLGLPPFYLADFHPWSSVYALFFMLLSEERILLYLKERKRSDLAWAGAAVMLAFGFRQPCGVVMLMAGALTLLFALRGVKDARREWSAYGAGAGVVLVPYILYLTVTGSWSDYFRQTLSGTADFAWERGGSGNWGRIVETMFPMDTTFWIFPLAALGLCLYAILRADKEKGPDLTLLAAAFFGLAAWHQFYPVPCMRHLYWASIPMFPVFALLLQRILMSGWKFRRAAVVLLVLIPAGHIGFRAAAMAMRLAYVPEERRQIELPGVRGLLLFNSQADHLEKVKEAIAAVPAEFRARPWLNLTPDALYGVFFPNRENLHPLFINGGRSVYPDFPETVARLALERQPVIFSPYPAPLPGWRTFAAIPPARSEDPVLYLALPPEAVGGVNRNSPGVTP